jgi:LysR family transcriptional activator of nhaA
MRHLNYNHLQYFWAVAREGSIVAAARLLNLTPQTISGQLKLLEESVGEPLFSRAGRRLLLTKQGDVVFRYADEIFTLGAELGSVLQGTSSTEATTLNIGVVSSMPKLIAERIIAPVFDADLPVRIRCVDGALEQLLADVAVHRLDIVLSDQPLPRGLNLRAYNHRLGESGMSFFAASSLWSKPKKAFPENLHNTPMLLPSQDSALRRQIEAWLERNELSPLIAGEFDDSALMKAFGEVGAGIFPAPTVIEQEICRMYRTDIVGRTQEVTEHYYAISPERKLKHPLVVHITEFARTDVFPNG